MFIDSDIAQSIVINFTKDQKESWRSTIGCNKRRLSMKKICSLAFDYSRDKSNSNELSYFDEQNDHSKSKIWYYWAKLYWRQVFFWNNR